MTPIAESDGSSAWATGTTFTEKTIAFSNARSLPVSLTTVLGQHYAIGVLEYGTATPTAGQIAEYAMANNALGSYSPIMNGTLSSQTDISDTATVSTSSLAQTTKML